MAAIRRRGVRPTAPRRRLALLWAIVLVVVTIPVAALANPPATYTGSSAELWCDTGEAFLGLRVEQFEDEAFADLWIEFYEDGMYFGSSDEFEWNGEHLVATFQLFEQNEEEEPVVIGEAFVDATWEPSGETEVYEDRFRDGNRWVEIRETWTPASITGIAIAEPLDLEVDLSGCEGAMSTFEESGTNPNAFIGKFEGRSLGCSLEGDEAFGSLFAFADDQSMVLDLFVEMPSGPMWGFSEEFEFTDEALLATVELFGEFGPAGLADVDAALTSLGLAVSILDFQDARVKLTGQSYEVEGVVHVDETALAMVDCYAESWSDRIWDTPNNGPKPVGKAPVNDVPEGALSLDARATTNAQTKATANPPEAECLFDPLEEEPFPLPVGKTLWYTFEGNGSEMVVDTAGSNFDTVLGIYTADLEQVACSDDVPNDTGGFSLQAAAAIPTVMGETYLVQVGGFGFFMEDEFEQTAEFGRVRISVE